MFGKNPIERQQIRRIVAAAVLGAAIVVCVWFVVPMLRDFIATVILLTAVMAPLWLIPVMGIEG